MLGIFIKSILLSFNIYSALLTILITTISEALNIYFTYSYIKRELKYEIFIFDINILKYLFSAFSFFICYKVANNISDNIYLIIIITIIFSIIIYFIILYFILKDLKLKLVLKIIKEKIK